MEAPHAIVSSDQLASNKSTELSEFEYGLIISWHAYSRWLVRCMSVAGIQELTPVDILILHHLNHQNRDKKLADICFVLNIEDTHIVSYALRKMASANLVKSKKLGKESLYSLTRKGIDICESYRQVRETCLMAGLSGKKGENQQFSDLAGVLRALSGHYDQAARAASSI
ncbi:MAG: winged helix DNA-binding protein [Cellvibrionaceae bacterium]